VKASPYFFLGAAGLEAGFAAAVAAGAAGAAAAPPFLPLAACPEEGDAIATLAISFVSLAFRRAALLR